MNNINNSKKEKKKRGKTDLEELSVLNGNRMRFKRKWNILICGFFLVIKRVEARCRNRNFSHATQRQRFRSAGDAGDAVRGLRPVRHPQRAEESGLTSARRRRRLSRNGSGTVVATRRAVTGRSSVAHLTRGSTSASTSGGAPAGCIFL